MALTLLTYSSVSENIRKNHHCHLLQASSRQKKGYVSLCGRISFSPSFYFSSYSRSIFYFALPIFVGNEIAGVVIETGEGVKHLSKVIIQSVESQFFEPSREMKIGQQNQIVELNRG